MKASSVKCVSSSTPTVFPYPPNRNPVRIAILHPSNIGPVYVGTYNIFFIKIISVQTIYELKKKCPKWICKLVEEQGRDLL